MLNIFRIVMVAFAAAGVIGLTSRFLWLGDLCSHFYLQYAVVLSFCMVGLVMVRSQTAWFDWLVGGLALFFCLVQILLVFQVKKPPAFDPTQKTLKIILANVNSENRDFGKIINYVNEKKPDLFGLIEINDAWQQGLAALGQEYHHTGAFPHEGNFGLGVFSRIPLLQQELKHYGATGIPSVEVRFEFDQQNVLLLLTHPYPPVRPKLHGLRNDQLNQIAHALETNPLPTVVMGDFNATPFTWAFQNFLRRMNLKDSRWGFGFQATWPSVLGPLGIPIDHVLLSPQLRVLRREVGPEIGSDHRPVFIEIAFNKNR